MDEKCTEIPDVSNRYCLLRTCRASLPCEKVHPIYCAAPGSNTSVTLQQASPQKTQHQPLQTKTLFALFINHVIGFSGKICRMLWSFIPNAFKSYTAWVVSISEFVESHLSLISFSIVVPDP